MDRQMSLNIKIASSNISPKWKTITARSGTYKSVFAGQVTTSFNFFCTFSSPALL